MTLTVDGGQVKRRLSGRSAAVDAVAAAATASSFVEENLETAVGGGRRGRDVHQRLSLRVGIDVARGGEQVRHHLWRSRNQTERPQK